MEKFDVIPVAENAPDRGDYPKIGNSNYRFNLWYKFPKKIKKLSGKRYDNYGGGHNFESDDLIDYMRESMSGIKLVEDFDAHDTHWLSDGMTYSYRVGAFIPERKCGIDGVYAQKDMKSFDEIDFEKSGEWIAKMLEKAGAVLDIKKCNEIIKKREEEAKELLASRDELSAIVNEAINSDKSKEEKKDED